MFLQYSIVKLLFFFFFPYTVWKQVSRCVLYSSHGVGHGIKLYLLKGVVFTQIIWDSSERKIDLFSHIYLFSQEVILYGSQTSGSNPVLCYLLCCSNCFNFGHWQLFQVGFCSFDMPLFFCFLALSCTTGYSKHILYFLCPNTRISHFLKEPLFVFLELWVLG